MKKLIAMIMITAMAGMSFAATTENNISKSEITEVTVYSSNAHITRETELNILKGTNIFRIKGLSPYINEQSLQVLGTGDIVIHSFHYEVNYLSSIDADEGIKLIIGQIKALEKQILFKKSRIEVLDEQKDLMDKNKRLNENGLSVEELTKLVQYFDEKLTEINNEILELQFKVREFEEQKSVLDNQLAQFNQKEKIPSGEIVINIQAGTDLSSVLEISYLTTHAGWLPAYDIKVIDVESDINLVFKAALFNNTGEDWEDVKLILSNGNPNISGILPTMFPWYLDIQRMLYNGSGAIQSSQKRSMPAALEMAMEEEMDLYEEPTVKPLQTAYIEQQTTVEYIVEKPYTLKSNNESVQVDLKSFDIPSTYKYYTIPKLDRSAYLVARIENWEQQGLLDGSANLYFQSRYVGKSYINTRQLSDTFNISLGQDKSILIEREITDMFQKKNLIGSDRIDTRGYRISVRNKKSKAIDIVIYDQIPISANNEIVVKPLETGMADYSKNTGKLTWEWTIDSNSSKETVFGYEVKYPKEELVVLN